MRIILFVLAGMAVVLFSACSSQQTPENHLAAIYTAGFDCMVEQGTELNRDLKYIAVDTGNVTGLNAQETKEIFAHLRKEYKVDVIPATFENFRQIEEDSQMKLRDGILLRIEDIDYTIWDNVKLTGSKYREGIGEYVMEMVVKAEQNEWVVNKHEFALVKGSEES